MKSSDSNKLKYVAILSHLYNVARKRWNIRLANPVNDIEKPRAGPGRERRLEPAEFASDSATKLAWLINQDSPTARDGDDADHGSGNVRMNADFGSMTIDRDMLERSS